MEKVEINHPLHEHTLILREIVGNEESVGCYVCRDPIGYGEWVYVCIQEKLCSSSNSSGIIFHKRCGELPTPISHPSHPQHPLHLVDFYRIKGHWCSLCERDLKRELGYRCFLCDFNLDITCERIARNDELVGEPRQLEHPCHIHPLTLMRKPAFVFSCDGCSTEDRDKLYTCITCDLLIHKTCAMLPLHLLTNHHHHQLSLSSCFPFHHRNFQYQCSICRKDFNLVSWVYYCNDCRFFAHLKCVTSQHRSNLIVEKNDCRDLVKLPLEDRDISNELITPFVIGENAPNKIPDATDMPSSITLPKTALRYSLLFNNHMHTLSLVSNLSDQDEDRGDDDDDDDVKVKICDLCVTPISSPPYYECSLCNYFVHFVCCFLPKTLSSLDSHLYGDCPKTNKNHNFELYTSLKKESKKFLRCDICDFCTNGMVYHCRRCRMVIDVKCACLPTTIKHAFHPHHKLMKTRVTEEEKREHKCHGCGFYNYGCINYLCTDDNCDFILCPKCFVLPKIVMKREWDKHPLPLLDDANIDHPTDFYCGFCEEEMNPMAWMYHCRLCDNSFHPKCLETGSGYYKNVKFGRRLEMNRIHPHTLTFSYITLAKWCSICHRNVYTNMGLTCSSCYYVVCLVCGRKEWAAKIL